MKKVIIPDENKRDCPIDIKGIEVVAVSTVEEVLNNLIGGIVKKEQVC